MPNKTTSLLIKNGKIVLPDEHVLEQGSIYVRDGMIVWMGKDVDFQAPSDDAMIHSADQVIDANGDWVLPGFIDIHVHGGFGSDFMDANVHSIDTIARFHNQHGTTAMLATSLTASREVLSTVIAAADQYIRSDMPYAQLLGVHLEGPFICHKFCGAQNPNFIVPPQLAWIEQWIEQFPGIIRQVTLAPETDHALPLIAWLDEHHIIAACGHTDASYEQIELAVEQGLRHGVHTFNAMRMLHHREPGTVGAVLTDDRLSAEVIADGHHVHPACIKLIHRAKQAGKMLLVTDAMSAAGLNDGDYALGALEVKVHHGVARLTSNGSLAGSTLTMIAAMRFMVEQIGLSVPQASRLASGNPASLLGIANQSGDLTVGKQADILLISESLHIRNVWVKGRETFANNKTIDCS